MRPPILSKYPVDKIISNFKSSKEKEMWIVRFIPQILNKQKINANAISANGTITAGNGLVSNLNTNEDY